MRHHLQGHYCQAARSQDKCHSKHPLHIFVRTCTTFCVLMWDMCTLWKSDFPVNGREDKYRFSILSDTLIPVSNPENDTLTPAFQVPEWYHDTAFQSSVIPCPHLENKNAMKSLAGAFSRLKVPDESPGCNPFRFRILKASNAKWVLDRGKTTGSLCWPYRTQCNVRDGRFLV